MGYFNKFNSDKCRTKLHLACNRAKINKNKLSVASKYLRLEIAGLLKVGKYEVASIKTERLLHDQNLEKAYEELQTFCEILAERMSLVESSKWCPVDLVAVVDSILFCVPRTKIEELSVIKDELAKKYGKTWVEEAIQNTREQVHYKLIQYLSLNPPLEVEIVHTLSAIAKENGIHWIPPNYPHHTFPRREISVSHTASSSNASRATTDYPSSPSSRVPPPTAPPPPNFFSNVRGSSHFNLNPNTLDGSDFLDQNLSDRINQLKGNEK